MTKITIYYIKFLGLIKNSIIIYVDIFGENVFVGNKTEPFLSICSFP